MFTVKEMGGTRVVEFDADVTTGEAYGLTQCADDIHDGDVLVVESEGVVGVMVAAWPTAVTHVTGEFHGLHEDYAFETLDGGKYADAAKVAAAVAAEMEV